MTCFNKDMKEGSMKQLRLAIVGATGAVGHELIKIVQERKIPYTELRLLASKRSAGTKIDVGGKEYTVEEATLDSFRDCDAALFAGGPASKAFGRDAAEMGCVVIDNSSTFRYEPDVPLVVPEVNPEVLTGHHNLIANPNCSTILLVTALWPIHKHAGVKRAIVSTYQACSGAGKEAMDELCSQSIEVLEGKPVHPEHFKYQIAFNVIPQIDVWVDDDYTKEEMKLVWETHKIMGDDSIGITPVCAVRVPVMRSHCEAVYLETEKHISPEECRELLSKEDYIVLHMANSSFTFCSQSWGWRSSGKP